MHTGGSWTIQIYVINEKYMLSQTNHIMHPVSQSTDSVIKSVPLKDNAVSANDLTVMNML